MDRFGKFTVLLNSIARSIYRIKCAEMGELGLKSTHVSCLYYLYRAERPLNLKELCGVCGEDKAAVSRAVNFLGREGYVAEGSAGKYRSPLSLTKKGEETAAIIAERIESLLAVAGGGIPDGERETLYKNLQAIADNLQKLCEKKGDIDG